MSLLGIIHFQSQFIETKFRDFPPMLPILSAWSREYLLIFYLNKIAHFFYSMKKILTDFIKHT